MALKILAVDDSATMRTIMKMTFAGEDAEVLTVTNGDDAVAKAKAAVPDLVFADASMAGLDGYDVARAIRADPALAKTAVIVMASQHHPFNEAKAKACGVDDHILKPFDSKLMIEKANAVATARRTGVPVAAAGAPAATSIAAPPVAEPPKPPSAPQPRPAAVSAPLPVAPPPVVPAPVAPPPPAAAAASSSRSSRHTMAFDGAEFGAGAGVAASAPAATPSSPPPASGSTSRVTARYGDLASKLTGLGLSADQVTGVLALSREVIEQVVWEVVPELAEVLIKEEIKRLTAE